MKAYIVIFQEKEFIVTSSKGKEDVSAYFKRHSGAEADKIIEIKQQILAPLVDQSAQ